MDEIEYLLNWNKYIKVLQETILLEDFKLYRSIRQQYNLRENILDATTKVPKESPKQRFLTIDTNKSDMTFYKNQHYQYNYN